MTPDPSLLIEAAETCLQKTLAIYRETQPHLCPNNYDVSFSKDKLCVALHVNPNHIQVHASALENFRTHLERELQRFLAFDAISIVLTAPKLNPSPAPSSLSGSPGVATKRRGPAPQQKLPGVQHIVAVASGKGGVGKSTTACNLALSFSLQHLRVGLLDADIYGPSLPTLFGIEEAPALNEQKRMQPHERWGIKLMSMGFLISDATAVVWRAPMIISALTQMLREVAWGNLDLLIVDLPPGTGDIALTLAQNVPLSGAIIVSTPQDLALKDARRAVTMFQKLQVPILGIIENMSYFICPHCQGRSDIFAHGGARQEAKQQKVPFLGEIPLSPRVRETADSGSPLALADPKAPEVALYQSMAAHIYSML